MTDTASAADRYHAFDALRASMMLLGIVLHAAVNYMTLPVDGAWPYKDPATSPVADLLVVGIHVFRMPVFFVMAGFFTALLVERRGVGGMCRNRFARVTLPFAVFWTFILPATLAAAAFAIASGASNSGAAGIAAWMRTGPYWANNTAHLWFLWYLTAFYAIVCLVAPLARRVSPATRAALSNAFRAVMQSPSRALVFAMPTAVVIWFQHGILQTALSFVPAPFVLLGYGMFFAFGWGLWHHQPLLDTLPRFAWTQLAVALVLMPVNLAAAARLGPDAAPSMVLAASVTGAVMVWLMIFGISGLAIRWAHRERPWVRYLTDASYWMYLIHVPLMLFVPGLLANTGLPALARLAVVLMLTTPVLVLSYDILVRDTPIGVFLNGRRYPRRLAVVRSADVATVT